MTEIFSKRFNRPNFNILMADFYEEEQKTDIKTDVIRLRDQLDGNDSNQRKIYHYERKR